MAILKYPGLTERLKFEPHKKELAMKKHIIEFISALAMLLFFAASFAAQTGSPVTGSRFFRFTLFDENGLAIPGALIDQTLNVTNGIFKTTLDFGEANFPGANRSLEIAAKINAGDAYTVLDPRQEVLSAPYSIKSKMSENAAELGGLDAGEYLTNSTADSSFIHNGTKLQNGNFNISSDGLVGGTLGIGTTTPRAALDVGGNAVQNLSNNGFVKASALLAVTENPQGQTFVNITRCFNGNLNFSTGNCGFTAQVAPNTGGFRIRVNFGFTVNDRFVSFTELDVPATTPLNQWSAEFRSLIQQPSKRSLARQRDRFSYLFINGAVKRTSGRHFAY